MAHAPPCWTPAPDLATLRTTMEAKPDATETLRFDLAPEERGQRLDQVLVAHVPGWSRTRLSNLIQTGHVRINGAAVTKPGLILLEEGRVEVDLVRLVATRDARFKEPVVLYEDEHLVALDKQAGTLTHGNQPGGEPSAASWAQARYGELPRSPRMPGLEEDDEAEAEAEANEALRAGIVHRLDRDTSGVLLIARTDTVLAELKRQFQAREVAKTYAALVHGDPRFDSDWIEGHLGRKEQAPDRISVVKEGEGRFASTYYEVKERFTGFARLAVFPKTGRTHQVRVHLGSIELSIVGETLYVPKRKQLSKLPPEAPPLGRQALHAERLEITHPVTKERIYFESPWPADMQALLDWLRKERPGG